MMFRPLTPQRTPRNTSSQSPYCKRSATIPISPSLHTEKRVTKRDRGLERRRMALRHFCRLFDLPGEIRNRVYDFLFAGDIVRIGCHRHVTVGNIRYATDNQQPPVSRACRRLRQESLPRYYSNQRFQVRCSCYALVGPKWLDTIRSFHVNLSSLDVWVHPWSYMNKPVAFRFRKQGRDGDIKIFTTKQLEPKSIQRVSELISVLISEVETPGQAIVQSARSLLLDPKFYRAVKLRDAEDTGNGNFRIYGL